jgi:hypothetical protein
VRKQPLLLTYAVTLGLQGGLPLFFLLVVDLLLRKRIEASKTAIIKPIDVRPRTAESPVTVVGVPKISTSQPIMLVW